LPRILPLSSGICAPTAYWAGQAAVEITAQKIHDFMTNADVEKAEQESSAGFYCHESRTRPGTGRHHGRIPQGFPKINNQLTSSEDGAILPRRFLSERSAAVFRR